MMDPLQDCSRLTSSKTTTVEEREPKFYPEDFDIRFGSDVMKAMTSRGYKVS